MTTRIQLNRIKVINIQGRFYEITPYYDREKNQKIKSPKKCYCMADLYLCGRPLKTWVLNTSFQRLSTEKCLLARRAAPSRPTPTAKLKAPIDGPEKGGKDKRVYSGTYLDLIFPEALLNQDLLYTPGMIALQLDDAVALNGPTAGKLRFEICR
jgi:hypothetical protein